MSKSPSLRRIQADVRELSLDPSDQYYAAPLESDMHEWHFTIRGAPDTDFAGGIYHGRILLPPEYPFKPPHVVFLTPSGRFETHTKICLSFSAFHPELWQPAWGIRLILEALIAFLPSPADGAIGALNWSSTERKRLAAKSKDFCCPCCGKVANLLPALKDSSGAAKKPSRFQKEIEELTRMQSQAHKKTEEEEEKENKKESEFSPAEEKTAETPNDDAAAEEVPADGTTPHPTTTTTNNAVETTTAEPAAVVPAAVVSPAPVEAEATPITPRVAAPAPPRVEPLAAAPPPLEIDMADENDKPSWLVEPALQLAIVVLSVICFLLIRKIQALCAELQALDD